LDIYDTEGSSDYSRTRHLSYSGADIFLLCFSVVSPTSFSDIRDKWWLEISHHCPNATYIVVGCKLDLQSQRKISVVEGNAQAKAIKALCYRECSSLTGEGVTELLNVAIEKTLISKQSQINTKEWKCRLL